VKVLVVEDDPVIAMGLEQKLIELGYGVAGRARTGKTAVELVLREPPDALLLDLKLPDLDGIEVARRISAGGIHVPIVVITAHEDPHLAEQAISMGVAAYLLKPVSRAQLGSAVELAISRQAEFEALRADIADLRQALETRKLVERAKGLLMDRGKLQEAEAFAAIQRRARRSGRTMNDVAAEVLRAAAVLSETVRTIDPAEPLPPERPVRHVSEGGLARSDTRKEKRR
jgi:two-component system, response regulator PdtaR